MPKLKGQPNLKDIQNALDYLNGKISKQRLVDMYGKWDNSILQKALAEANKAKVLRYSLTRGSAIAGMDSLVRGWIKRFGTLLDYHKKAAYYGSVAKGHLAANLLLAQQLEGKPAGGTIKALDELEAQIVCGDFKYIKDHPMDRIEAYKYLDGMFKASKKASDYYEKEFWKLSSGLEGDIGSFAQEKTYLEGVKAKHTVANLMASVFELCVSMG